MNSISKSFASLVAYNNGEFKSQKQAAFLLSQTSGNVYTAIGNVYGNSFNIDYYCDKTGVFKVEQFNCKSGKVILKWEREESGKLTIQDKKAIKTLTKRIKKYQESIDRREMDRQDYVNKDRMDLFNRSMKRDVDALNSHKYRLELITNKL